MSDLCRQMRLAEFLRKFLQSAGLADEAFVYRKIGVDSPSVEKAGGVNHFRGSLSRVTPDFRQQIRAWRTGVPLLRTHALQKCLRAVEVKDCLRVVIHRQMQRREDRNAPRG